MGRKRKRNIIIEDLEILDTASEGKALGKYNDKVVFVPFVMPGDIVDVQTVKNRKKYYEAKILNFKKQSEHRIEPECEHFGVCGGCKWQHIPYEMQAKTKENQVKDNLQRIGGFDDINFKPILKNKKRFFYRNKLEYTFCNMKWIENYSKDMDFDKMDMDALGFHAPGRFDRVLNIEKCHLQKDPSNDIRNFVKTFAKENNLEFFDLRKKVGFLRNMIIRTASTGDLMVILIMNEDNDLKRELIMNAISNKFPEITSLMYIINDKLNDSYTDLDVHLFKGNDFIMEQMEDIKFKIGPKSFYQTNSEQAYYLYKITREYSDLQKDDIVYDLYTGTGTIANFIANKVKKVVGVEYVPEAIEDAKINSEINNIKNTVFYAGDMANVLNDDFVKENGKPDLIIIDPPRAGMHPKVVEKLNDIKAKRIVYVSCNPATQARDMKILSENYKIIESQPVDMFPQTHHVENVLKLELDSKI